MSTTCCHSAVADRFVRHVSRETWAAPAKQHGSGGRQGISRVSLADRSEIDRGAARATPRRHGSRCRRIGLARSISRPACGRLILRSLGVLRQPLRPRNTIATELPSRPMSGVAMFHVKLDEPLGLPRRNTSASMRIEAKSARKIRTASKARIRPGCAAMTVRHARLRPTDPNPTRMRAVRHTADQNGRRPCASMMYDGHMLREFGARESLVDAPHRIRRRRCATDRWGAGDLSPRPGPCRLGAFRARQGVRHRRERSPGRRDPRPMTSSPAGIARARPTPRLSKGMS